MRIIRTTFLLGILTLFLMLVGQYFGGRNGMTLGLELRSARMRSPISSRTKSLCSPVARGRFHASRCQGFTK